MSVFGDRRRRGGGNNQSDQGELEFYEDTHPVPGYEQRTYSDNYGVADNMPKRLPKAGEVVSPRNYQNVIVYKPTTPDDVQTLIDFLKRREPAIVNLDEVEETSAQRVLDFVSGAIYALNGSIHRIAGNIFLLSPEGIEVAVTYEDNK